MAEREYWLDRKENVTKVYRSVWVVCALLIIAEPLVHLHPTFTIESSFGFYGWFGFVACVGLVLAAKGLRVVLKRPEDYYDAGVQLGNGGADHPDHDDGAADDGGHAREDHAHGH